MAKKKQEPETAKHDSVQTDPMLHAIFTDEYAGQGGSYIYDPATGKRTPVKETEPPQE